MRKFPFDDESCIKLRHKSEKALMEWFWQVLVLVRLVDWLALDFKACWHDCSLDAILKSGGGGILGGSLLATKYDTK